MNLGFVCCFPPLFIIAASTRDRSSMRFDMAYHGKVNIEQRIAKLAGAKRDGHPLQNTEVVAQTHSSIGMRVRGPSRKHTVGEVGAYHE